MSKVKTNIRKGDEVIVLTGKYKKSKGRVLQVFPEKQTAIVEGINMKTKHSKPSAGNPEGGRIQVEGPIQLSNLAIVDPKTGGATRIKRVRDEKTGKLTRIAKKSGEEIK